MEHIGEQNLVKLLSKLHTLTKEKFKLAQENQILRIEKEVLEHIAYMVCSALSSGNKKAFDQHQIEMLSFACEEWKALKLSRHTQSKANH